MGQRRRDRTRDFFSLGWLLDPGADDRRAATRDRQSAADLWMREYNRLPSANALYAEEQGMSDGQSAVHALGNDRDYQASQAAQMRALRQMQGIADGGGYTQLERDQIAQAQRQAAQYEQAQRQAQVQQMQMRGMGGGGAEMAARMQAQQSGANQGRADATNIATAAQMRALQAMQGAANTGAGVQTQANQRASAVDAFNQANTQRQQNVAQRNAANQMQSRQNYVTNRMQALAGRSGQYNANANANTDEANRQAGLVSGLVGSLLS